VGLTWLHLSDWHQRREDFNLRVVRDALIEDLRKRVNISPDLSTIDFIIFSGDIAFSGQKEEYEAAIENLFNPLLETVNLDANRLFIVPGNHDLNRNYLELLPPTLLLPFTSEMQVGDWLTSDRKRSKILAPFEAYSQFVSAYCGQDHSDFASIRRFNVSGKQVALLGLNSALMCARNKDLMGGENDYGNLVVGEPQLHDALKEIVDADVRIAVLHHPFGWLTQFERLRIEERLCQSCHFILNGHQHLPKIYLSRSSIGECLIIPAGASYNRRVTSDSRYVNAYNFVHLDFAEAKGKVYLRRWSDRQTKWIADTNQDPNGEYIFTSPTSDKAGSITTHQEVDDKDSLLISLIESSSKPVEIFYSYSHKDEKLRNRLETHLSLLKQQGLVINWHDRKIGAGKEWENKIEEHLNTADIILLLISPDFLASDYCYSNEMNRALERHERGEANVIPIILRRVYWQGAQFGKLQALPTDGKPVTGPSWHNQDEAFFNVVEGIRKAVEEIRKRV
jgi:predicted phosphodiesterase